jgi:proteasome lid subunit RPN8/RPN11
MTAALFLAAVLREQLEREARAAFPRECCGLIEGRREGDAIRAVALHPTRNLSAGDDSFEIDPAGHIALTRALRGTGRQIVGCYHSHPNGRAEPSGRDWEGAGEEDFVWLIAALRDAGSVPSLGAFMACSFAPVAIRALAPEPPATL